MKTGAYEVETGGLDLFTGKGLRMLREACGLSRPKLAEAAEIDPSSVKYWEKKQHWKKHGWAVERMLRAMGVEVGASPTKIEVNRRIFAALIRASAPSRPRRVICGAKTRKGHPCRAKSEPGKRRCKFHGGMSTGPKTPEGKAKVAAAARARWARLRAERC